MSRDFIIGVDTSNYTTSVAVISPDGQPIANIKRPLPVAEGACGLRQSDALFAHIKNLPDAMNEAREYIADGRISAVGVSERPRNVEGSYMPCFLAGVATAESIGAATGAKVYRFSHQCGHIMAAVVSSGSTALIGREFAAFHISGGTTELVRVYPAEKGFSAVKIGGTADLNAGQVIDRIGVMLGLPFPCGRHIKELATLNKAKIPGKKISFSNGYVNLSGLENMAKALYAETADKSLVSAFVLDFIRKCIERMSDWYLSEVARTPIVYAGGVMSNKIIRAEIERKYDARFAEPQFSADNAFGVAYLAYLEKNKNI